MCTLSMTTLRSNLHSVTSYMQNQFERSTPMLSLYIHFSALTAHSSMKAGFLQPSIMHSIQICYYLPTLALLKYKLLQPQHSYRVVTGCCM